MLPLTASSIAEATSSASHPMPSLLPLLARGEAAARFQLLELRFTPFLPYSTGRGTRRSSMSSEVRAARSSLLAALFHRQERSLKTMISTAFTPLPVLLLARMFSLLAMSE